MIKFVPAFLFAAVAIAAPAVAETAARPIAFERAGIHYVATVTDQANGSRMIAGREIESGRAFTLTVAKGMVDGVYNGQPVNYAVPSLKHAVATRVEVANTGM